MHGEGPCVTPGLPAAVKDTGGSTVGPYKGCGSDDSTASTSVQPLSMSGTVPGSKTITVNRRDNCDC